MSINNQKAINALEIRDTSPHTSDIVNNGDIVIKTLIIENGLNQAVTFQCQGSANADFSNYFNIGATFEITAATNTFVTCDTYIPYWRTIATCSVAPTSGNLSVIAMGVS